MLLHKSVSQIDKSNSEHKSPTFLKIRKENRSTKKWKISMLKGFFLWSEALNSLPACNARRAMALTLSIGHFWKDWKTPKYFYANKRNFILNRLQTWKFLLWQSSLILKYVSPHIDCWESKLQSRKFIYGGRVTCFVLWNSSLDLQMLF